MPLLPSAFRRALRDKALAASRRLSTGPEWEGHVRREFGLLAPGEGWREQVTDGFHHRRYYEDGEAGRTWKDTRYLGVPTWKVPLDLWVYQELLWELRPVPPAAHLCRRLLHRPGGGRPGGRAGPGGRPGAGGAGLRPPPRPCPGRAAGLCPPGHPGQLPGGGGHQPGGWLRKLA